MCSDLGLKQTVTEPTRKSSCLDLFFTNNPNLVEGSKATSGLSDHDAVLIKTKLKPIRKKPLKRTIHLWNKADESKLKQECNTFKSSFCKKFNVNSDIEDMWQDVKSNLLDIMNKNVPTKYTSSKHHQPWINTTTKRLIRKKQRWFSKAKKCNSDRVWNKYKQIKSECQRVCRKTHVDYLNNIISEDATNKKFWKYIKNKNQENHGIADLIDTDNLTTQDPERKANLLNEQFGSVFSNPAPKINASPKEKRLPNMKHIVITKGGVLKLLLNINPNKATGPDLIPGKLLKTCANELCDIYKLLFQASLNQGTIPIDWKRANIMPLFKKGDKSKPENYRPVSLTSISCKLLEHIVHSNIMDHFDKFETLNNDQHGFRQKRSCETQLITTINDFSKCLNSKGQIDAILLDFSKAFDKVDHEGLLLKLENLGIRGSLLNWVRSFLINREQGVLVEGKISSHKRVLSGVPQGTVLGPLFFLIYINDISVGLSKGTSIKLFADDSLLFRPIKTPEDSIILQNDLNKLQEWERTWKMEFHPGKCQLIRLTNKIKNQISADYYIHNSKLELTSSAKYLGVVIDNKLRWKEQHSNICKKANNVLSFLRRNLHSCPINTKKICYSTLVRPLLEYGGVVWDPHHITDREKIEKVQKRAARFVTGNYNLENGNTKMNMQKLAWEPLEERRAKNKVVMLFKARQNQISIPTNDLVFNTRGNRKNSQNYVIPSSNIDSHLYSFFPNTIRLWNLLPADVQECNDVDEFKNKLNKITLRSSYL